MILSISSPKVGKTNPLEVRGAALAGAGGWRLRGDSSASSVLFLDLIVRGAYLLCDNLSSRILMICACHMCDSH